MGEATFTKLPSVRFRPTLSSRSRRPNGSSGARTPASQSLSPTALSAVLATGTYGLLPHSGQNTTRKCTIDGVECTEVNASSFKTPVQALDVSGGTAAFYALELATDVETASYWIGKDLSRAKDEIDFYELVLEERKNIRGRFLPLLAFMFEYAGVARCPTSTGAEVNLLVMRNLMDGFKKLRLLDLKIGDRTASAGWKGKSRMAALRQSFVDSLTNSAGQGFRLEGFDNPPKGLESQDPLLDFGGTKNWSKAMVKKANRVHLQRLPASDIFMHLLDVREMLPLEGEHTITACEWAESVMLYIVQRLVRLQRACAAAPVPQKWIGSSVALGFDCGFLPSRRSSVDFLPDSTKVSIFDWGRSEFNTVDAHEKRSTAEKLDRRVYWASYSRGINRLAWEAARAYMQRYSCTQGWSSVQVHIYDFDSSSDNDYIGSANLRLSPCQNMEVDLTWSPPTVKVPGIRGLRRFGWNCGCGGCRCCGKKGSTVGKIVISIEWKDLPEGSPFTGIWRIHLHRATNLVFSDFSESKADPMAVVTAFQNGSLASNMYFHQLSTVVVDTFNPVWEEVFELPVATSATRLQDTLRSEGTTTRMLKSMSAKSHVSWTSQRYKGTDWHWLGAEGSSCSSNEEARAVQVRSLRTASHRSGGTDGMDSKNSAHFSSMQSLYREGNSANFSSMHSLYREGASMRLDGKTQETAGGADELNGDIPVEPTPLIDLGDPVLSTSPSYDEV